MDIYKDERQKAKQLEAETQKQIQLDRRKGLELDQVTDEIKQSILDQAVRNREYKSELRNKPERIENVNDEPIDADVRTEEAIKHSQNFRRQLWREE